MPTGSLNNKNSTKDVQAIGQNDYNPLRDVMLFLKLVLGFIRIVLKDKSHSTSGMEKWSK